MLTMHPWWTSLIALLLTLILVYPAVTLDWTQDLEDWDPEVEEVWIQRHIIDDVFVANRTLLILVEGDDLLSQATLQAIHAFEADLASMPDAQDYLYQRDQIRSVADAIDGYLQAFGSSLADANTTTFSTAFDAAFADQALQLTGMVADDFDPTARTTSALLILIEYDVDRSGTDATEWGERPITEYVDEAETDGFTPFVLGGFGKQMDESALSTLPLMVLALVIVLGILVATFRSPLDVGVTIIGLPLIFVWTFGIYSLLGLGVTTVTFFAPILILALGIDYIIHTILRDKEFRRQGVDQEEATLKSISITLIALSLATLTTSIGFLVNLISPFPAVADFGVVVSVGIISAFLVMGIFVPILRLALRRRFPFVPKVSIAEGMEAAGRGSLLSRITMPLTRFPWIPILLAVMLTLTGFAILPSLESDFKSTDVLAKDSPWVAASEILAERFPGIGMENLWVLVEEDITDPGVLTAMLEVQALADDNRHAALVEVPGSDGNLTTVAVTSSPASVIRQVVRNDWTNYTDIDQNGIPDDQAGVLQAISVIEADPELALEFNNHIITINGEITEGLIVIASVDSEGLRGKEAWEDVKVDVAPLEAGNYLFTITGPPVTRTLTLEAIPDSMIQSMAIALVLVLFLLVGLFRSFKDGFVTSLSVVMVFGWLLLTMWVLDYDLNIVTVFIAGMSIGVGIDYSIHITQRYREEKSHGTLPDKAMDIALGHTGVALLASTLTTALGFGVIYFSPITMFTQFGLLTALMITYSFLASVLILPSLHLIWDRFRMDREPMDQGDLEADVPEGAALASAETSGVVPTET